jgi:DNA-binding NtrC family response regulator
MELRPTIGLLEPLFVYGQGAILQSLNALASKIAETNVPVMLTGERGTGKRFYAKLVHRLSGAPEETFALVSCGSPDIYRALTDLRCALLSEDANAKIRPTTVFLHAVNELNAAGQDMLLSFLVESDELKGVRGLPRIISSTRRNLEGEVEAGRFQLELYYRINGATLRLPLLRERKEDIPDLLEWFIVKHSRELARSVPEIGRYTRKLLYLYDWPGNIRELENVARKIVATGSADSALDEMRASNLVVVGDKDGGSRDPDGLSASRFQIVEWDETQTRGDVER